MLGFFKKFNLTLFSKSIALLSINFYENRHRKAIKSAWQSTSKTMLNFMDCHEFARLCFINSHNDSVSEFTRCFLKRLKTCFHHGQF